MEAVYNRMRPWLGHSRLDRPADLGLLWLLGLWGLWLGGDGRPAPLAVLLLLLALLGLRTLAWLLHDLAARPFGAAAWREVPSAQRAVAAGALVLALGALLLLGWPTLALALGAVVFGVAFLALRRRSFLGELLLGLAVGTATLAGFTAAGALPGRTAWLVYTAAVVWSSAALTQYAVLQQEAHRRDGIKSVVMLFGGAERWLISLLQAFALVALWLAGQQEKLGIFITLGVLTAAALGVYQQVLMAGGTEAGYRRAWFNNLWFGLALFCGIAFAYLCRCTA